jgi:hypothetical protein
MPSPWLEQYRATRARMVALATTCGRCGALLVKDSGPTHPRAPQAHHVDGVDPSDPMGNDVTRMVVVCRSCNVAMGRPRA